MCSSSTHTHTLRRIFHFLGGEKLWVIIGSGKILLVWKKQNLLAGTYVCVCVVKTDERKERGERKKERKESKRERSKERKDGCPLRAL